MGEHGTFDKIKRQRITEEEFQKVVSSVNSIIGDMLTLIWHTGMRPYEICEMRPFDILRDDPECWIYIPGRDNTPVGMHKPSLRLSVVHHRSTSNLAACFWSVFIAWRCRQLARCKVTAICRPPLSGYSLMNRARTTNKN